MVLLYLVCRNTEGISVFFFFFFFLVSNFLFVFCINYVATCEGICIFGPVDSLTLNYVTHPHPWHATLEASTWEAAR